MTEPLSSEHRVRRRMTASEAATKIHFRQLTAMRCHELTKTDPGQIWGLIYMTPLDSKPARE